MCTSYIDSDQSKHHPGLPIKTMVAVVCICIIAILTVATRNPRSIEFSSFPGNHIYLALKGTPESLDENDKRYKVQADESMC